MKQYWIGKRYFCHQFLNQMNRSYANQLLKENNYTFTFNKIISQTIHCQNLNSQSNQNLDYFILRQELEMYKNEFQTSSFSTQNAQNLKESIFKLLSQKERKLSIQELENLSLIISQFNAFDYQILQQLFLKSFVIVDELYLSKSKQLLYVQLIKNLKQIIQNFSLNSPDDRNYFFSEKDFPQFLNRQLFSLFQTKFLSNFQQVYNQIDFDAMSSILNIMSIIMTKYQKVDYLQGRDRKDFCKQIYTIFKKNQFKMLPTYQLNFFFSQVKMGNYQIIHEESFNQSFIKNKNKFQKDSHYFLFNMLEVWKLVGSHDQEVLRVCIKPLLLSQGKIFNDIKLVNVCYSLLTAKIYDPEILNHVLKMLNKVQIQNLRPFIISQLHIFFQLLEQIVINDDTLKEQIWQNYSPLINMANNFKYNCAKHQPRSLDFKSSNCFDSDINYKNQNQQQNNQENDLISIVNNICDDLKEPYKICHHYNFCQFNIDAAIFLKDHKLAVEIYGNPYTSIDGDISGKKNNKFFLLESQGWKNIKILVKDGGCYQKKDIIRQEIIDCIEQQIGRNLDISTV